jgi:pentatricopeptide repeat protein
MFYNYTVLKGFQLNHKTYYILIEGLCELGETKLAIHLLREALQIDKELKKEIGETKTVIQLLKEVLQSDKEQKYDALACRSLYELIIPDSAEIDF